MRNIFKKSYNYVSKYLRVAILKIPFPIKPLNNRTCMILYDYLEIKCNKTNLVWANAHLNSIKIEGTQ